MNIYYLFSVDHKFTSGLTGWFMYLGGCNQDTGKAAITGRFD